MRIIGRHQGAVDAIVLGPRGEIITAGRDGHVRRWEDGASLLRAAQGSYHVLAAGPALVAGNTFGELVWLDWDSGATLRRTPAMYEGISCLAARADGLVAVGGDDCAVRLYDTDGNVRWAGETYKFPYAMRFSSDGTRLLIATWDAYLYDVDMDALPPGAPDEPHSLACPRRVMPIVGMPYFDALYLPDGNIAFSTAGEDGTALCVIGSEDRERRATVSGRGIHALSLSADGRLLAGGGNDQIAFVWDSSDLTERARFALDVEGPASQERTYEEDFIRRAKRRGITVDAPHAGDIAAPSIAEDAYYPAFAEYYEGSGPGAIFALAWHPARYELFAGTQAGAVLAIDVRA